MVMVAECIVLYTISAQSKPQSIYIYIFAYNNTVQVVVMYIYSAITPGPPARTLAYVLTYTRTGRYYTYIKVNKSYVLYKNS